MKNRTFLTSSIVTLLSALLIAGCAGGSGSSSSAPLNFGDGSAGHLMYMAGTRKGAGDWEQVKIYADKIVESLGAKGKEQNAGLKAFPDTKTDVWNYGALNNASNALITKAEALEKLGDIEGAKAVYNDIIENYSYGQSLILGKWYKAGEVAKKNLSKL